MNKKTFEQLMNKLETYIDTGGVDPSVSPTLGSGGGKATTPDPLFITKGMDIDGLDENQLLLTHTLLHRFYASGGIKDLHKKDIERLHEKVARKIEHVDFDKLDKK